MVQFMGPCFEDNGTPVAQAVGARSARSSSCTPEMLGAPQTAQGSWQMTRHSPEAAGQSTALQRSLCLGQPMWGQNMTPYQYNIKMSHIMSHISGKIVRGSAEGNIQL